MQFRKPEWDVEMPEELAAYWTAWNEQDLDLIPGHLRGAVAENVEWNDPNDSFTGLDNLERHIAKSRIDHPHWVLDVVSKLDYHHDRYRYRWDLTSRGRILMEGLDVVSVDSDGLITRVDGFFGEPTPLG